MAFGKVVRTVPVESTCHRSSIGRSALTALQRFTIVETSNRAETWKLIDQNYNGDGDGLACNKVNDFTRKCLLRFDRKPKSMHEFTLRYRPTWNRMKEKTQFSAATCVSWFKVIANGSIQTKFKCAMSGNLVPSRVQTPFINRSISARFVRLRRYSNTRTVTNWKRQREMAKKSKNKFLYRLTWSLSSHFSSVVFVDEQSDSSNGWRCKL